MNAKELRNILQGLQLSELRKNKWIDEFGNIKDIMSIVHKEYRIIAIGSKLLQIEKTLTFFDFLLIYLQQMISTEWIKNERGNRSNHPLILWLDATDSKLEEQDKRNSEYFIVDPNDKIYAVLNLAYDLYTIDHNHKLQTDIIKRMKNIDQFYGARYELFVASICVRSGFNIEYENESDKSKRHVEFIGIHKSTGDKIGFEAKYKMRNELGENPNILDEVKIGNIARLINNAVEKNPGLSEIIFIELNLPSSQAKRIMEGGDHFHSLISHTKQIKKSVDEKDLFNIVYFTNITELFSLDDNKVTRKPFALMQALNPKYVLANNDFIRDSLSKYLFQYGRIPKNFQN